MEQKFKGNFIAIYKESHKEELLKKMHNLTISEDREFRSFKEIVSTDFKKLITLKDKEIEKIKNAFPFYSHQA